jgi:hypothetical protein
MNFVPWLPLMMNDFSGLQIYWKSGGKILMETCKVIGRHSSGTIGVNLLCLELKQFGSRLGAGGRGGF